MKKIVPFLILILVAIQESAQRQTDLPVTVTSPQNGALLLPNVSTVFAISLKNNGPANLIDGDTIFFSTSLNNYTTVGGFILDSTLAAGQSLARTIDVFSNNGQAQTDMPFPVCLNILNPNTAGITIGGLPVSVSYNDPDTGNNRNCVTVTLKGSGGTGINDPVPDSKKELSFYPNPAQQSSTFTITLSQAGKVQLAVYDTRGKKAATADYGTQQAGRAIPLELNTSDLPTGLYFVEVSTTSGIYRGKLVVQH